MKEKKLYQMHFSLVFRMCRVEGKLPISVNESSLLRNLQALGLGAFEVIEVCATVRTLRGKV